MINSLLKIRNRLVFKNSQISSQMNRNFSVIRSVTELRNWRLECLKQNHSVGLVPTMGALHQGHLTLIGESLKENDNTIVSIFVNPAQFAPNEDLNSYPRTWDSDLASIERIADGKSKIAIFAPTVSDMYPSGITTLKTEQKGAFVKVKGLSEQLEGAVRPQFFEGVATVVTKLFNVTLPTRAYFGQKDVQQSVLVQRLVKDLLFPIEIKVVPTVRERSGLAMSSRNSYLSTQMREKAGLLYNALKSGENLYNEGKMDTKTILNAIRDKLGSEFEIEYVELTDTKDLEPVPIVDPSEGAIISAAIRVPNNEGSEKTTRIIDNIILKAL